MFHQFFKSVVDRRCAAIQIVGRLNSYLEVGCTLDSTAEVSVWTMFGKHFQSEDVCKKSRPLEDGMDLSFSCIRSHRTLIYFRVVYVTLSIRRRLQEVSTLGEWYGSVF